MKIIVPLLLAMCCMGQLTFARCSEIDERFISSAINLRENAPGEALKKINRGISELRKNNNKNCEAELGKAFVVKGIILRNLYRFEEAVIALDTALEIRKTLNDVVGIASVFNNLSSIEKERGNYEAALNYSMGAIKFFKEYPGIKDSTYYTNLGNSFINAANILIEVDSLPAVEGYLISAKDALNQYGETKEGLAIAEYNLALAYIKKGKLEEAEQKLQWCKDYYASEKDTFSIGQVENGFGQLRQEEKKYVQARQHFEKSIQLLSKSTWKYKSQLNLARNFLLENKPDSALAIVQRMAIDSFENIEDIFFLERIRVEGYRQFKDTANMVNHLQKLDSLSQQILAQVSRYDNHSLKKIEETTAQLENAKEVNRRNRLILIGMMIIGVLISIIFFLLIKAEKRRTQEQKLEAEKAKIEIKKKELHAEKAG